MHLKPKISNLKSGGLRKRPLSFPFYGSIYLFLLRLGCGFVGLHCSQVIADFTSSDRQVLSSIKLDTSAIRDGSVNGFVNLLEGTSYNIAEWNMVYNYITGGALNQKEKHSLTDFSIISYLGMTAQSLGALSYNFVSGEPVSSVWHPNRLSLYDALVGWDPARDIESFSFTNGLLNGQQKIIDKMDIMTNQFATMIRNQTNLLFSIGPHYKEDSVEDFEDFEKEAFQEGPLSFWYTASPASANAFLPYYLNQWTYQELTPAFGEGSSLLYTPNGYNQDLVSKKMLANYGNLRDPASINPTSSDNAQSWVSDANAFVRTAKQNAPDSDAPSVDNTWSPTFASGYVEGATVGLLDGVSEEVQSATGPPKPTFDLLKSTFTKVVKTTGSDSFTFGFSVDFGNGASTTVVDTDLLSSAPQGFLSSLRTQFTKYVTAWHNLVHVFILCALWMKTIKIVTSAFSGGDEV